MVKFINAKLSRILLLLISFALICCLPACGGSKDSDSSDTGSNTTTTDQSAITLTLSSSSVSYGTPVNAYATVLNEDGDAAANIVVTFSTSSSLVTFDPTSATALTNSSGIAIIQLNAASLDSSGAVSISASATPSSASVTSTAVGIAVNGSEITLGAITLGANSISAYGTSSITLPVYVDSALSTVPISVVFTSNCVSSSKATISTPVTTVAGYANSTYTDSGCSQTDKITASVSGATNTSSANIVVAAPATTNIEFTSATPSTIGTSDASSASLQTSSVVKFRVVDSNNNGVSGTLVDFSVVPASKPGGLYLSDTSATSDSSGYVSVSLISGTVPTPVWVVATVDGTALKSQSNTLTITTGLPTQNFFSLSASTCNIEGWAYDGVTSTLTIIASDRLGTPVPDGTAVNFITEGAQVSSSCTTSSGTCSATFTSSAYRPTDGRVTVLAYALGEKSFVDTDGDNAYDSGETYYDIGDPYIDANENSTWDSTEQYIPSETAGSSACYTQPAATSLPSDYDNALSKENTCTAAWGQNYVRRSYSMVLSGSFAYLSPTTFDMDSSCLSTFSATLTDVNGNAMPAATTISISDSEVYFKANGATTNTAASVSIVAGTPVASSCSSTGTTIYIKVKADCSAGTPAAYPSGTASVVVTTPKGNITYIPITVY